MLLLRPLALFTALVSAAALPSSSTSASTSVVLADLQLVEKAVEAQIDALNKFTGGLLTPVQLVAVTATFDATVLAITKAAADVALLPGPLSASDSKAITDQLAATLEISDPKVVNLIKSKRPLFDAVLLRPVVQANLIILQTDHLALSGGLVQHMDPAYTSTMQQIADVTTNALKDGIAYYALLASKV